MRTFSEERHLPHAPAFLFEIIADVDRYAEFLPWCVASRVRDRQGALMIADLSIGFGSLRETFTSRVMLDEGEGTIRTIQEAGPFRHLESHWCLRDDGTGGTAVRFSIEFEFRSILLQKLMGSVFDKASEKMVTAFEERAAELSHQSIQSVGLHP